MNNHAGRKKHILGFVAGFVLTTAGFLAGGFALTEEAVAAAPCDNGPSDFSGWRCVNGGCVLVCVNGQNANDDCQPFGTSCIMGPICTMGPCPG